MKKVIVVSKTHLDLGFTDYAEVIHRKYLEEFIPQAVELAQKVNTSENKNFIWTTGSWLIKEALENSDADKKARLIQALRDGNIVPHALPFTTHSELFDSDTFDFGLSIVDGIDEIRGVKTVSAKMTDVPGHTKAIVPLLAKHGVKLLHIGVNGVSAVPEVPECFLWKCGDAEVVVVYSGDYGGAFKSDLVDEVLYFDHTLDNHGAPSPEKVMAKLSSIRKEYPGYRVCAGTLDEFAQVMWAVKDKLPVYEGEIGDTWIHGSAADPYKSASLRELMSLKKQWLADGTMTKDSKEYKDFSDALLCIGEHTCGMDVKTYFADYEHYLKPDFQKARKRDKITIRHPFRDFPYNILNIINKIRFKRSYSIIEKSWQEQRGYIDKAVNSLSSSHKAQAQEALRSLRPEKPVTATDAKAYSGPVSFSDFVLELNDYGGIGSLTFKGQEIIHKNNNPLIEYRSYTSRDYDFWFEHYARNMKENSVWGYPDFGRPLLKCVDGKYPAGRFFYKTENAFVEEQENCVSITANLKCDKNLCESLGAPRDIQVIYTLSQQGLDFDVSWYGKDASRLTEAIFLHLYPAGDFTTVKIGDEIDYKSTASMGGRNLHAVQKCLLKNGESTFELYNCHSPLISPGQGKILEYDNKIESVEKDGISYVLCDNVWGTNFPLWYEDNARFNFRIINIK